MEGKRKWSGDVWFKSVLTENAPLAALKAATAADKEFFSGVVVSEFGEEVVCRKERNAAAISSGWIGCHIDGWYIIASLEDNMKMIKW